MTKSDNKTYTKTHQIAPVLKKIIRETCPEPPSKVQWPRPNLGKKVLPLPPPAKSAGSRYLQIPVITCNSDLDFQREAPTTNRVPLLRLLLH